MQEVTYAGGTFITGDDVADTLMQYAAALANADRAATIDVPTVGPDGPSTVKVLIGPASQVSSAPVEHDGPEPDGRAFLDEARAAIREHQDRFSTPDAGSPLDWDVG